MTMQADTTRKTNDQTAIRDGYIVLGMHRSGTSAITGSLIKLGIAGPNTPYLNGVDNQKGHWESLPLITFHDELLTSAGSFWHDWLPFNESWFETVTAQEFKERAKALLVSEFGDAADFVLKDPRICRYLRFWLEIFNEQNIYPRIILPVRNPLEVAQSLKTRDGFTIEQGLLFWLAHVLEAENSSRGLSRAIIAWDAFLYDWQTTAKTLAAQLGIQWPNLNESSIAEVNAFLEDGLKHERATEDALRQNTQVHIWVLSAYESLRELEHTPNSERAFARLDEIRLRYHESANLFGSEIRRAEVANQSLRNELSSVQANAAAQQAEHAESRAEIEKQAQEMAALIAAHNAALTVGQQKLEAVNALHASEKESLFQQINGIQSEQDRLNALNSQNEQQLAESRAEIEKQAQEMATLIATHNAVLNAEQQKLEAANAVHASEKENLLQQINGIQSEQDRLNALNSQNEQQLADSRAEIEKQTQEIAALIAAHNAALTVEQQKLEAVNALHASEKENLSHQINGMQSERDRLIKEVEDGNQRSQKIQYQSDAEKIKFRNKINDLHDKNSVFSQNLIEAHNDNSRLKALEMSLRAAIAEIEQEKIVLEQQKLALASDLAEQVSKIENMLSTKIRTRFDLIQKKFGKTYD